MFFRLLYPLHDSFRAFNVFRYATFRSALAAVTAPVLSLVLGPWLIRRLRHFQIGQEIREEGPASHQTKKGTPTMGGLLIITAIVLPTLMWVNLANPLVWIATPSIVLFGLIGFLDDYLKLTRKRNLGLRPSAKFGLQLVLGALIGLSLMALARAGLGESRLQ